MPVFPSSLLETLLPVLWVIVPVFLFALFWQLRLMRKRQQFLEKVKWDMLEVRIPRENIKSPKSMEQVFASVWGIYSYGINWINKYLDGKINLWVSFEVEAQGGGIRFFIRTPRDYRNLIESSIYGQYPQAEISDAEDYTQELPSAVPNETYDLFGTGFTLAKDAPYPIKTYQFFDDREFDDEKRIDPLSPIFEAMSKLGPEERIWIQCLVSATGEPTGVNIKKEGEELIKKIIDENTKVEGEEGKIMRKPLTHGMQDVIKAIESKISKSVFQVSYRFLYLAPRDKFNGQNIPAVMGSFQQFNTQNMNSLKPDSSITIFGGWIARYFPAYKNARVLSKKRMLFDAYITRQFGKTNRLSDSEVLPIFSTEELATLYHYPILTARAPRLQRIGSRRSEPPVNLPVE